MGKHQAEYEFYPSEDKHEGDCHRYCGKDYNGLSDSGLTAIELRQNPYQRDQYSLNLVFDTPADKRDLRQETVLGLLAGNAGIADARARSFGNASGFSVDLDNVTQQDLMRIAVALTQPAPKGRDDFHYPVMDQAVTEQILSAELDRLKMTPVEAGLVSIATDEMTAARAVDLGLKKPVSYVDVDFSGYPLTPVALMREEGSFSEIRPGEAAMRIDTSLTVRDGQAAKVAQALQDAGIKAVKSQYGNYLSANAPADGVAAALQKAGMMPPVVADAVKAAAEKAHPGQQEINVAIDANGQERLRRVSPAAAQLR